MALPTAANANAASPPASAASGTSIIGQKTGTESSLSNWAGPYVTDILGKAQAVGNRPYEAYTGPLTAGPSALQQQAFQGIGNLAVPTEAMGAYTPQTFGAEQASQYMNPYVEQALQPQLQELQRQQDIRRVANAGRMTRAGSYGGGRQAIMESELDRAGLDKAAKITGLGYLDAYKNAQQQFNAEQERQQTAQKQTNTYGLDALRRQAEFGSTQRGITESGVAADRKQFEMERADPQKQLQFQQSLLQGLPLKAQQQYYAEPSDLASTLANQGAIGNYLQKLGVTGGGSSAGADTGILKYLTSLFDGSPLSATENAAGGFDALGGVGDGSGWYDMTNTSYLDEYYDDGMTADDFGLDYYNDIIPADAFEYRPLYPDNSY